MFFRNLWVIVLWTKVVSALKGVNFIIYECMPAPILHRDLWPTVRHLVHTIATRGDSTSQISSLLENILTIITNVTFRLLKER